jgi:hypothetical protein
MREVKKKPTEERVFYVIKDETKSDEEKEKNETKEV